MVVSIYCTATSTSTNTNTNTSLLPIFLCHKLSYIKTFSFCRSICSSKSNIYTFLYHTYLYNSFHLNILTYYSSLLFININQSLRIKALLRLLKQTRHLPTHLTHLSKPPLLPSLSFRRILGLSRRSISFIFNFHSLYMMIVAIRNHSISSSINFLAFSLRATAIHPSARTWLIRILFRGITFLLRSVWPNKLPWRSHLDDLATFHDDDFVVIDDCFQSLEAKRQYIFFRTIEQECNRLTCAIVTIVLSLNSLIVS